MSVLASVPVKDGGYTVLLPPVHPPAGQMIRPRRRDVLVACTDRTWKPAEVRAWHRLAEPQWAIMTGQKVTWALLLRFANGDELWCGYDSRYIRTV